MTSAAEKPYTALLDFFNAVKVAEDPIYVRYEGPKKGWQTYTNFATKLGYKETVIGGEESVWAKK